MESDTQSTEIQSDEAHGGMESLLTQLTMRLVAAVELLERAVPLAGITASEAVGPIVAMVESSSREADLGRKLAEAEKTIAELRASSSLREGRKTLPVSLLAKQDGSAPEPGAIDAALVSLSLEQRIAVKAQLLRSGLM